MIKRAICLGINDYPGATDDLFGCVNDAYDWSDLLLDVFDFGEVETLTDAQVTKQVLLTSLQSLIASTNAGDVGVLTFSGHGTRLPDNPGHPDESDGFDEAICAYDDDVSDDEVRSILARAKPGARLTIVSDTCHSGTVTRAIGLDQRDEQRFRFKRSHGPRPMNLRSLPLRRHMFRPPGSMSEILLAACDADELASEDLFNNRHNGVMSALAIRHIREQPNLTYRRLHQLLSSVLPSQHYDQTPQLEGADAFKDRPLFD